MQENPTKPPANSQTKQAQNSAVTGKNSSASVPDFDLVKDLAVALEQGALIEPGRARSLIRAWSEREDGWTTAQASLARSLIVAAVPMAGQTIVVPPFKYRHDPDWRLDQRPERKAVQGIKSGIVRRHRLRDRNRQVMEWYEAGEHTVQEIAELIGRTVRTVWRIIREMRHGPDLRRRTVAPKDRLLMPRFPPLPKVLASLTRTILPTRVAGDDSVAYDDTWMRDWLDLDAGLGVAGTISEAALEFS